jgi:hypothetical protein
MRVAVYQFLVGGLIATAVACGDGGEPPPPPAALVLSTQPQSTAQSGVAFSQQPIVQLRDASGSDVALSGVSVTASVIGGGTLSGAGTVQTDGGGRAVFADLAIHGLVGTRALRFHSGTLSSVVSNPIVLMAGPATRLVIFSEPSSAAVDGLPFAQQPGVQLRDAADNWVRVAGAFVNATIASGGGTLTGTATVQTDTGGYAWFPNLAISGSPGNRTLQFAGSFAGNQLLPDTSVVIAVQANPCTQSRPIAVGQPENGTLTTASCQVGDFYEDRWALTLGAPATVQIDLTSGAFDTYLYLADANGSTVEVDDDGGGNLNSRIIRTLPAGSYLIRASTYTTYTTGAYQLAVQAVDPCAASKSIPLYHTASDTLTTGSCQVGGFYQDRWELTLGASTDVILDLTSSALDAYLILADANGDTIEVNDDASGTNARIARTLAAGTYLIRTTTHAPGETGAYQLGVHTPDPCTVERPIALGETAYGTLTTQSCLPEHWYEDRWVLTLDTRTEVAINEMSDEFDSYLILADWNTGNIIEEDDDDGDGLNSRIIRTLDPGTYLIRTTTYWGGATGSYTLDVRRTPCSQSTPVALGETANGTLSNASCNIGGYYEDLWILTLGAGADVQIDQTSGAFDTYLIIADNSGSVLETDDDGGGGTNSRIVRTLAAGTYYIRAGTYARGATGAYQLAVQAVSLPGGVNLQIDGLYLTQATQPYRGNVPLVGGKDAYLRVFVLANQSNALTPPVRVRLYQNGTLVNTYSLTAPGSSVPVSVDEGSLGSSWNLPIAASLIQTGLSILADVDPDNLVAEANEADNTFPLSGTALALDVRNPSPFDVTFVPVQQPNGLLGDVTAGNAPEYLGWAKRVYPLAGTSFVIHATYASSVNLVSNDVSTWSGMLSEMGALRAAEGSSRYYYGVAHTNYTSGIIGIGNLPGPAAVGWDRTERDQTAAHEWGHNFGRYHAPGCGAGGPDPNYPYANALIGVYGFDLSLSVLRSPTAYWDLMSYCRPYWVSDYTYNAVFNARAVTGTAAPHAAQRVALVWGQIGPNGVTLQPVFQITAPPSLPRRPGRYRIQGLDSLGRTVFDVAFEGDAVDHAEGERQFAFTIPSPDTGPQVAEVRLYRDAVEVARRQRQAPPAVAPAVRALRLPAPAGRVRVQWDATAHPMALIRDAATGQVLSFARGGTIDLPTDADELELVLSDGVRSASQRIKVSP